jgi:hypothetical protein
VKRWKRRLGELGASAYAQSSQSGLGERRLMVLLLLQVRGRIVEWRERAMPAERGGIALAEAPGSRGRRERGEPCERQFGHRAGRGELLGRAGRRDAALADRHSAGVRP